MYPRINIHVDRLHHNAIELSKKLDYLDELYIVTKGYSAYIPIIDQYVKWGFKDFADSRMINIKNIKKAHPEVNTLLLRLPLKTEVKDVIKYADRSLNSELETIKALDKEAKKQNKTHEILLMIDLGDLREGIMFDQDYISEVEEIVKLENIKLMGIGTNLTCYGAIIPTRGKLDQLVEIKEKIENSLNIKLPIISGGNSSSLPLALDHDMPKAVNNLRIGEAFINGHESAYGHMIDDLVDHIYTLEAEIIEVKNKPSLPIGKQGVNAFGEEVDFEDVGVHRRIIIGIGRQDVSVDDITPHSDKVKILGSSSDHLILETIDDSLKVGDTLEFDLSYGGILSLFTSKYVGKHLIKE